MRLAFGIPVFLLVCIALFSGPAIAQEEEPDIEEVEMVDVADVTQEWWANPKAYALLDRAISVFSARSMRKHSFLIVIDHRLHQQIDEDPFHDLLGFDAGNLKVGLGLRFGVFDFLDLGMYRLNGTTELFDTYEFDGRWQILDQEHDPLNLALRSGVSWFAQEDFEDAHGFFGQLLFNRKFIHRLNLGGGFLYHSESSGESKALSDQHHSSAVAGYAEYRFSEKVLFNFEIVGNVSGFAAKQPAVSSAVKIITNRHSFAILISNTRYISADGIVSNTPNDFDQLTLGFFITREIGL